MNISVIGGQGFIGRHLVERGKAMGHRMTSIDVAQGSDISLPSPQLTVEHFEACERIIWSAGILGTTETFDHMQDTIRENISNMVHILWISQHLGIPFTYITLGNDWLNPYTITKNCGRDFCRMFALDTNVQIITTYNVFGPYQKVAPVRKMVPYFMTQLLKGEPIELFFDGQQQVDMVYAPDLANEILENLRGGEFFMGTGRARSVRSVAQLCADALQIKPTFTSEGDRHGETGEGAISPVLMKNITPIETAMLITAKWYKEHHE